MTLEELLNKLIEKGWRPRGFELHGLSLLKHEVLLYLPDRVSCYRKLRELVSIESGLWQYVCKNHLYIYRMGENKNFIQDYFKNKYNECCYQYLYDKSCYEYYLLESALCDEDKLKQFLLDNINIEG